TRYCLDESMYAIAPGAGIGKSCVANACLMRAASSDAFDPLSTHSATFSIGGSTVRVAGGLKQRGARTRGFQNVGSSRRPEKERSTRQVKPFVPWAASTKPVRVSTSTVAESD